MYAEGAQVARRSWTEQSGTPPKGGGRSPTTTVTGKIYQIENQNYAGLADHAAQTVKLTGSLAGDTINVSQVVMTEKGKG